LHKSILWTLTAIISCTLGFALAVTKGDYPIQPNRMVLPGIAGSSNHFMARAIAQRFTEA